MMIIVLAPKVDMGLEVAVVRYTGLPVGRYRYRIDNQLSEGCSRITLTSATPLACRCACTKLIYEWPRKADIG